MARAEQEQEISNKKVHNCYDYSLLFLTIFLVCFGLVMIYSTSSYTAKIRHGNAMHFLKKQTFSAALGIFAMIVVSKIDYRIYIKKLPVLKIRLVNMLYLIAIVFQTLVLFLGDEIKGQRRWLEIGPINFQPSEISKIAVIIFIAYIVNKAPRKLDKLTGFLRVAVYVAPLLGLIVKTNLSTAIVVAGIMFTMCFVASRKKWYFILVALGLIGSTVIFITTVGYRGERFDVWLNVETHEKGFQILQGLYAIASGGIFGRGLGESMQKLGFIPESHNDMIFTVICEELGLFGAAAVILLFILLIWRIFVIAISSPDLFGGLICVGVLTQIAIQVIINIAVVTNSIPSTGIPLPFISYGGTSISILLAEMGIVLSVSRQIKKDR